MTLKPMQILLVEDEIAHAELMRLAFSKYFKDIALVFAQNITQALEILQGRNFDLIISDWRLPDGEALDLLKIVKEKYQLPFVVITSYGQDQCALTALKAGAMDYIVKGEQSFLEFPDMAVKTIREWQTQIKGQRAQRLLVIHNNLETALGLSHEPKVAIRLFLNTTARMEGLDIGLAYMVDPETGGLELVHHYGFSPGKAPELDFFKGDSTPARLLNQGKAVFTDFSELSAAIKPDPTAPQLKAAALLPLIDHGKIIGALCYLSKTLSDLPPDWAAFLETAALRLASWLAGARTQLGLAQANGNIQSLLATYKDFLFIMTRKGRLLQHNPTVESRLGYTAEQLAGMDFIALFPPDRAEEAASLLKLGLKEMGHTGRTCLSTINGHMIPVETKVYPGHWCGREVLICLGRDMPQPPRNEKYLPESEENLRLTIENAPIGIFQTSISGKPLMVNPAAAILIGFDSPKEILQDNTLNSDQLYAHPEDRKKFLNLVLDTRGWFSRESELIRRDGRTILIKSRSRVVRDESGEPRYIEGFIEDITRSRMAEEALRRSEKRYRSLYESMRDGYCEVDNNKKIINSNSVFQNMVGYSPEELARLTLNDITPEKWHELGDRINAEQVLPRGYSQVYEKEYRRKDGTIIPVELRIHLIRDENGLPMGRWSIIRDITERKRVEADLKRAKLNAEKANQAKSLFLANMSHEIRTPLSDVIGMINLLLHTELTAEQKEYIGMLQTSADNLFEVISDILDYSKIEAGKIDIELAPFLLVRTVEKILEPLALKAENKNVALILRLTEAPSCRLRGDAVRIKQVISNLVGNAIKFTEKGHVLVEVKLKRGEGRVRSLFCQVEDTGPGVAEDKKELIFKHFTQVDESTARKYGGTGLGLAISKQLVELMGGNIHLESQAGRGTTFWFEIPVEQLPSDLPADQTEAPFDPAPLAGLKVLAAISNPELERVIGEYLVNLQCIPHMAGPAGDGLFRLLSAQKAGQPYDLVIIDQLVSDENGKPLIQTIQKKHAISDSILLVVGSAGRSRFKVQKTGAGIAAYLPPTFSQTRLAETMLAARVSSSLPHGSGRPAAAPKSVQSEFLCPDRTAEGHLKLKVLLVEDNPANRKTAMWMLQRLGCSAVAVENGQQALKILNEELFDLVLMDIQMPEMDGFQTSTQIRLGRKEIRNLPIVAMTASVVKDHREQCLAAGIDKYLTKPVKTEELANILKSLITENKPEDRDIVRSETGNVESEPAGLDFDLADSLDRYEGEAIILKEIIDTYLHHLPLKIQAIEEGLAQGSPQAVERAAHGIKGGAAYIGAVKIRKLAQKMEHTAKSGNLSITRNLLPVLNLAIETYRQAILETDWPALIGKK